GRSRSRSRRRAELKKWSWPRPNLLDGRRAWTNCSMGTGPGTRNLMKAFRLRPWHVLVCVLALSVAMIVGAYAAGSERAKDILLGLGTNLLSSAVFFLLLET